MRRPRASAFGGVLARLHENDRIGRDVANAARLAHDGGELFGRGRRVEHHPPALAAELFEIAFEMLRLLQIGEGAKLFAQCAIELARIDIKAGLADFEDQRVGERQRRMRDVGAANVEQPRDRMRIADDKHVVVGDKRREPAEFPRCVFAGVAARMQADSTQRRRRALGPERIDGVRLDGDQFGAGAPDRLVQPLDLIGGMQPGVIAKARALAQIGFEPFLGSGRGKPQRLEDGRIDLVPDGQRIAPVDENRGAVAQHNGDAGRAAEARQPGEALLRGGHIFVLMPVGARNDESIKAKTAQFGAQGADARGALRGVGLILEGLKDAFKHESRLGAGVRRGNPPAFQRGPCGASLRVTLGRRDGRAGISPSSARPDRRAALPDIQPQGAARSRRKR